jgi:multiple sugar transport system substrate-binding protein
MWEMRKVMAVIMLLVVAIWGFAGGQSESGQGQMESGQGAEEQPLAGTTLSIASMNDPFNYVIEEMLPMFEEETGIDVQMEIIPYNGLRERTMTDLVSGSASFDVITMDIVWMGEWAEAGFITQLDEYIESDNIDMDAFIPGALEGLAYWDGDTYGMPIGAYHFLMHYRTDLLEEAGMDMPTTYDEVMQFGSAVQSPSEDQYGIAVPMVRGAPIVHYSLAYLSGAGGGVLNENREPTINSSVAREVYDYYEQFLEIGPDGMPSYDWFAVSDAYQQGRVAMLGAWNVVSPGFENPEDSQIVGQTEYSVMPTLDEGDEAQVPFGGWSLVINEDSDKKQAAWEFIKWITSEEVHLEYARRGGTPVRFDTLENEELQAERPWYETVLEIERNGLSDARYRPRIPQWIEIEETLGLLLNQAMIGQKSVDAALDEAQAELEEILSE